MTKPIIIAIDGYSSTGKSTVSKQLAKHLGYIYVDSGAMYRAVTFFALEQGLISETHFNTTALIDQLKHINISFKYNKTLGFGEVFLNARNIENEIRSLNISNFVSTVSAIPEIRKKLVEQQQKMGLHKGLVMDGRDIGTVVFPSAELKIFMVASAETRAQRRFKELQNKGSAVNYNEVYKNICDRDYLDTHRNDSPLRKAEDAIEIDNSTLTVDDQVDMILQLISNKQLL